MQLARSNGASPHSEEDCRREARDRSELHRGRHIRHVGQHTCTSKQASRRTSKQVSERLAREQRSFVRLFVPFSGGTCDIFQDEWRMRRSSK
jgi:hypothetical protein